MTAPREGTRLKGTRDRRVSPTKCPGHRACRSSLASPGSRPKRARKVGPGTWDLGSHYLLVTPTLVCRLPWELGPWDKTWVLAATGKGVALVAP